MALACDLRPLTPDEWLDADIAWRTELIEAANIYHAVYGPLVEKHRDVQKQQREADQRAKARR